VSADPDFCGCCGREIGTKEAPRAPSEAFFCQPCVPHLGAKAMHPRDRAYEAQFEKPCPFVTAKEHQ
jgi:hypothetical protein